MIGTEMSSPTRPRPGSSIAADRRALGWFLALSFGPTWLLWGLMWVLRIKPGDTVRFAIFGTAGMYFPGIAALVVRSFVSEDLIGTTLFRAGLARYYLWAWLLFPVLIAATIAIDVVSGAARPDKSFSHLRAMFTAANLPLPPHVVRFAVDQLILALAVGPLLHALTTIGEELGWRDFLLPRLMRIGFSQWSALIVSGAIWGLWHTPVILMGLEYTEHPYLGVPMFTGYAVLVGIILGWLQLASSSVWVPSLAHGSINAAQRAALVFVTGYDSLIGGPLGSLTGWIPLSAFIGWLVWSGRVPVSLDKRAEQSRRT